jgi:DNA ligase-1
MYDVVDSGNNTATLKITHGYIDGKMQEDVKVYSEGKNIGRANETTPFEQALKEAISLSEKKKDSGYSESHEDASSHDNSSGMFLPMLAHTWDKHSSKISFPGYVQPKFDGARMLARKEAGVVSLWSRKGKKISTLTHIASQLNLIMSDGDCLDGEAYKHGWGFQRIISAIKKVSADTKDLEYHIYDAPAKSSFEKRFVQKYCLQKPENIGHAIAFPGTRSILVCPTIKVSSEKEMFDIEESAVNLFYEGIMVRNSSGLYKYKDRSYDLQKVKRFEDTEFEIIGGKEASGRDSGTVVFSCITKDGLTFDVRPTGSIEERAEYLDNLKSYIGKPLTVKHQGFTDDKKPRFPVGLRVRPSWDV